MDAAPPDRLRRLLDANANRAREGLRVCEDTARFLWEDAEVTARCKALRHELTQACLTLEAATGSWLTGRDTPQDPGTGLTAPAETARPDASALFRANIRRVQEALRVLEETAKLAGHDGGVFKSLRYEAYTLESRAVGEEQP